MLIQAVPVGRVIGAYSVLTPEASAHAVEHGWDLEPPPLSATSRHACCMCGGPCLADAGMLSDFAAARMSGLAAGFICLVCIICIKRPLPGHV